MAQIHFTQHAVERFVLRHRRDLSLNEARVLLERGVSQAVRLREKTHRGQTQWQMQDPSCVLVTKFDRNGVVCVTILPEPEGRGIPEEELELMREYATTTPQWSRLCELHETTDKAIEALEDVKLTAGQRKDLHERIISSESKAFSIWGHICQMYLHSEKSRWIRPEVHERVTMDHRRAIQALRLALRYMVVNDTGREETLRAIGQVDPSFVTTAFITPQLLSRSERKEEVLRVKSMSK